MGKVKKKAEMKRKGEGIEGDEALES